MRRPDGFTQHGLPDPLAGPDGELGHDWIMRLLAVRRAGLINPVYVEQDVWYIGQMPVHSYECKTLIPRHQLRALIVELEAKLCPRMPAQSERRGEIRASLAS
jgi:hypothetical protein